MANSFSLTECLVDICNRPITAQDRAFAARLLLDWIGVASAGAASRAAAAIRSASSERHTEAVCSVIGAEPASEQQAAFINGCYGTLLEMDDLHRGSILHAGDVVIPAALAAVQNIDGAGPRLLDAIVVGYEIALRIGQSAAETGYTAWYNSGTCGVFGAAMAAAHAAKLTDDQKCDALGHAGMQAGGLWQCRLEPTDSKCLATGHAARAGITAACFAMSGLRGPRRILEGDMGFFPTFYPNTNPDGVILARTGWRIHEVSLKPWPACRHTHPAISCALEMRDDIDTTSIAKIAVQSYAAGVAFCDKPHPLTPHEARFSFQHAISVALLHGAPRLEHFAPSAIKDTALSRLRDRIVVTESAALSRAFPSRMGASLEISLQNGTKTIHATEHAPGDPEQPMNKDAVHDKFNINMTAAGVSASASKRILRTIEALASSASLHELSCALDASSDAISAKTSKDPIQ